MLHVVGLPHTETIRSTSWCAYTDKVRKFADMMTNIGHDVTLYAGETNEAACAEHVAVAPREWQDYHFPAAAGIPTFDVTDPRWMIWNDRAAALIGDRKQPGDVLCIIGGRAQAPIAAAHPDLRCVEFGIGYEGTFADFRVFESYAWMHTVYGQQQGAHSARGRFYDVVIPNYFEIDQFPIGAGDDGYACFVGRLIEAKGYRIAVDVTARLGIPLHVAGQTSDPDGWDAVMAANPHVVYHGIVGPEERAAIFGGAFVTFAPTLYVEPFGGVAVESMLCGTPVITTDWGAFTETVAHGQTGWRCRTFGEMLAATQSIIFDREHVRSHAMRYSTANVAPEYDDYLAQLATLDGHGWYDETPGRIR